MNALYVFALIKDRTSKNGGEPEVCQGSVPISAWSDGTCFSCGAPYYQGDSIIKIRWLKLDVAPGWMHADTHPHPSEWIGVLHDSKVTPTMPGLVAQSQRCANKSTCMNVAKTVGLVYDESVGCLVVYICGEC